MTRDLEIAANRLIGMTKSAAIELLEAEGYRYRVVKEDGESFIITMDLCTSRLNLTIDDSIVTNVDFF